MSSAQQVKDVGALASQQLVELLRYLVDGNSEPGSHEREVPDEAEKRDEREKNVAARERHRGRVPVVSQQKKHGEPAGGAAQCIEPALMGEPDTRVLRWFWIVLRPDPEASKAVERAGADDQHQERPQPPSVRQPVLAYDNQETPACERGEETNHRREILESLAVRRPVHK
jgi:hypothetical protein